MLAPPHQTESSEAEDTAADSTATTLLHECPECRTVYLSEAARSCSTCNEITTAVETTS